MFFNSALFPDIVVGGCGGAAVELLERIIVVQATVLAYMVCFIYYSSHIPTNHDNQTGQVVLLAVLALTTWVYFANHRDD